MGKIPLSAVTFAGLFALLAGPAEAQRSVRIDASGAKWTVESETACNTLSSSPYWLDVSGKNLSSSPGEIPALTFSGYASIPGSFNVFCQMTESDYSWLPGDSQFNNDPAIQSLIFSLGLTEDDVRGERYTFTTLESIYPLRAAGIPGFASYAAEFALGEGETASAYQWEITFFETAVVAALTGPKLFTGTSSGMSITDLAFTDSTTFVSVGGQTYGGNTYNFDTNYLCFGPGGSSFIGVIAPDQLDECLNGNPATVPIPGTLGLLGIGLAALWGTRRKASAA